MSNSIQKPIHVPVNDLIKVYGAYFALKSRSNDGSSWQTVQTLGDYSDVLCEIEQFRSYSTLNMTLTHRYKAMSNEAQQKLDQMTSSPIAALKLLLNKFGYHGDFRKKVDQIKNCIQSYAELAENPFKKLPVELLNGRVAIPEFMLDTGKYYYYPSYYNSKIIIRRMQVVKETIVHMKNYQKMWKNYDYAINYVLSDVDRPHFTIEYDFFHVLAFDGEKWGTELDESLLFISEDAAKKYVISCYDEVRKELD